MNKYYVMFSGSETDEGGYDSYEASSPRACLNKALKDAVKNGEWMPGETIRAKVYPYKKEYFGSCPDADPIISGSIEFEAA